VGEQGNPAPFCPADCRVQQIVAPAIAVLPAAVSYPAPAPSYPAAPVVQPSYPAAPVVQPSYPAPAPSAGYGR